MQVYRIPHKVSDSFQKISKQKVAMSDVSELEHHQMKPEMEKNKEIRKEQRKIETGMIQEKNVSLFMPRREV